jgi:hypothetical protein
VQESTPHPPASLTTGVAGQAPKTGDTNFLPGSAPLPRPTPSWASIVKGGAHASTLPAVLKQDFFALYEQCIVAGRHPGPYQFRHQAGSHEISISCCLSAPPADAYAPADRRRCQLRRKRTPTPSAAGLMLLPPEPGSLPPSSSTRQDSPSPAVTASPPAKWTQKATRHRCEVELRRETDSADKLLLTPISHALETPPSPKPVSPASLPVSASAASRLPCIVK